MTRTKKRTSTRRTSVPKIAKGYTTLLSKLSAASFKLDKSRPKR